MKLSASPVLLVLLAAASLVHGSRPAALQEAAEGPAPLSLERPGDGGPTCGLGKAFHVGRRREFARRVKAGLYLFRGLPQTRGYHVFRQDKTFWYLTGIESPDAALLIDVDAGTETLFLPAPNRGKERWEGEIWDSADAWVGPLTGFADVRPTEELAEALKAAIGERQEIGVSMHPGLGLGDGYDRAQPFDRRQLRDPLDGRVSREKALEEKLVELLGVSVRDIEREITEMRRVKTVEEIDAMRRAGRAGALALEEAMRSTAPGVGEWELDSLMTFLQVKEGAAGPAYHAIVGSGPNSCILHYSASKRRMQAGEVLLIDYGPELDHYTTDITRTWPVTGVFTDRMAELYDAVLAAQQAGIDEVAPGKTILDVEKACSTVLRERGFEAFMRHGACHYIGLEVHDPGDRGAKFVPGVVFTIEPGLYEEETGIGIRIEDVVVVTEDGCEVITSLVPKEREALESTVRAKGLLD